MSDLYLTGSETKGFPEKGETDYLTPQETAFVQRILRRAEVFPQEFWKAIMQKVALDGEPIPQSQVQGLAQFRAVNAENVNDADSTSSNTFVSLAHPGPTLSGLANGDYVFFFGGQGTISSGDAGLMTLTDEDTGSDLAAADDNGVLWSVAGNVTAMRALGVTLTNNNNNTVVAKYRLVSGTGPVTFSFRTLMALKVGN